MVRRTPEQKLQDDRAALKAAERVVARKRDPFIRDLERLARECDEYALVGSREGLTTGELTVAAGLLRSWADQRADAAVPKGGA